MPNFAVWIFPDLKCEVPRSEFGFSINSETSFLSSGDKTFLTLKISVKSFCRFLWWVLKELPTLNNFWNGEFKSLKIILRALSLIWFILSFIFLQWNIHTIWKYEECDVMKKFKINLLWSNVMPDAICHRTFRLWLAFLLNGETCSLKFKISFNP